MRYKWGIYLYLAKTHILTLNPLVKYVTFLTNAKNSIIRIRIYWNLSKN